MDIAGLVKNSFVDYPGKISFVIFTSCCNFDCFYCHNRDIIQKKINKYSKKEVFDLLEKKKGLIDAVTISGGEPTLQKDLIDFIISIKKLGFLIKLDSNGSNPKIINQIIKLKLVDYYAIDYKAPKNKYKDICNYEADNTLDTIKLLRENKIDFEVRTTLCPTLTKEDIETIRKEIGNVPKFITNKYRIPKLYKKEDEKRIFLQVSKF